MISLHLPLVLQCSVNIICNLVCNSLKENILSCIVTLFHSLSFVYFLEEWCGGQPACEWRLQSPLSDGSHAFAVGRL